MFPEIFLSLSIFFILIVGVFIKKSFNLIFNLTSLIIIVTISIILTNSNSEERIFLDSFIRDPFSNYFKILILLSTLFVLNSSENFIIDNKLDKFEYPIIILLSILGMFFMVSSNDLILFYLGLELQSLSLYILASIDRDNLRSTESGVKYFVLSALSSGLLLYGCSLLYGFTGSTNFELIADQLNKENTRAVFAMVFILVGLAFKVSAVPFHMWTPDVYEGSPTPVTAFFATVPKIAAVAVLLRVLFDCFGPLLESWQQVIILISVLSMLLGSIAAIGQDNIKRLMAYSSIGHIGFVLIGIASGTDKGLSAVLIYMVLYVIMNIGVFVFILNMERNGVAVTSINSLNMYNEVSKGQTLFLTILLFSLAGIPPLAGFFGKFFIFNAAINAGLSWLAIIGGISSVIAAFYYLRIVYLMYFGMVSDPLNGNMPTSHWLILSGSAILMLIGIINLYGLEGPSFIVAKSLLN